MKFEPEGPGEGFPNPEGSTVRSPEIGSWPQVKNVQDSRCSAKAKREMAAEKRGRRGLRKNLNKLKGDRASSIRCDSVQHQSRNTISRAKQL